jgi:hypothetical protein
MILLISHPIINRSSGIGFSGAIRQPAIVIDMSHNDGGPRQAGLLLLYGLSLASIGAIRQNMLRKAQAPAA